MNGLNHVLGVSWGDDALAQLAEIAGRDHSEESSFRRLVEHAIRSLYPFYSTDIGLTLDERETVIVDDQHGAGETEIWRAREWTFQCRWRPEPAQDWTRPLIVTFFAAPKRSRATTVQQLRWAPDSE